MTNLEKAGSKLSTCLDSLWTKVNECLWTLVLGGLARLGGSNGNGVEDSNLIDSSRSHSIDLIGQADRLLSDPNNAFANNNVLSSISIIRDVFAYRYQACFCQASLISNYYEILLSNFNLFICEIIYFIIFIYLSVCFLKLKHVF